MPYIKSPFGIRNGVKVFYKDGVCWKCGQPIPVGSFNWSYHTHTPGKYSHKNCTETPEQKPHVPIPNYVPPIPEQPKPKPVEVSDGLHHKQFQELKLVLTHAPRKSVYLAGSPGASKSFTIMQCAKELGLDYFCIPLCETTAVSDLLGYFDAHGKIVETLFRRAYTNGNCIIDMPELDNCSANVLTTINNAIDNNVCGFPDQMIERHKTCYIAGNGNTDLRGPTDQFPERRKQDAASIERFVFLQWDYDQTLEQMLYNGSPKHSAWVSYVQRIRKLIADKGIELVASQRAMRDGIALLDSGLPVEKVANMVLFKGHAQRDELTMLIPFPKELQS